MQYELAVEDWRNGEKQDLLNKFFPKFIYSSNKIRGVRITFIEIEDAFKYYSTNNQFPINNRLTESIKNHIKVCKNIFEIIEENESKLSVGLVKYLNEELTGDCFAEEQSVIREQIEPKLSGLFNEINGLEINEDNALSIISYLCCIVPYEYDNGVVIRVLVNYLLIGNNLPPIAFWENDIEAYHEALKHFSSTKKVSKMISFLEEQAYKTWLKNYNVKTKRLKDFL